MKEAIKQILKKLFPSTYAKISNRKVWYKTDVDELRMAEEKYLSNFSPIVIDFSRREGISPEHAQAILKARKIT